MADELSDKIHAYQDRIFGPTESTPAVAEPQSGLPEKIRAYQDRVFGPLEPKAQPAQFSEDPGTTFEERMSGKYVGPDLASLKEWLERKPGALPGGAPGGAWDPSTKPEKIWGLLGPSATNQYETQPHDGRLYVRPKGDQGAYKAFDPNTGFFSSDFLRDAADLLPEAAATYFLPGSTTIRGTAAITGGLEAARRGLGYLTGQGFQDNPLKAGLDTGIAAAAGGLTHGVLNPGQSAQTLKGWTDKAARDELSKKAAELATSRAALSAEGRAIQKPVRDLRDELTGEVKVFQASEGERISKEAKDAADWMAKKKAEQIATPKAAPQPTNVLDELRGAASRQGGEDVMKFFQPGGEYYHPALYHSAKILNENPGLRAIYQRHFGRGFAPEPGESSQAMATRLFRIKSFADENPGGYQEAIKGFNSDLADYVLKQDTTATIGAEAKAALKKIAAGEGAKSDEKILHEALTGIITKRKVPENIRQLQQMLTAAEGQAARERLSTGLSDRSALLDQLGIGIKAGREKLGPKPEGFIEEAINSPAAIGAATGRAIDWVTRLPRKIGGKLEAKIPGSTTALDQILKSASKPVIEMRRRLDPRGKIDAKTIEKVLALLASRGAVAR